MPTVRKKEKCVKCSKPALALSADELKMLKEWRRSNNAYGKSGKP